MLAPSNPHECFLKDNDGSLQKYLEQSKVVSSDLPTKQPSYLDQKILYNFYRLGHNRFTIL